MSFFNLLASATATNQKNVTDYGALGDAASNEAAIYAMFNDVGYIHINSEDFPIYDIDALTFTGGIDTFKMTGNDVIVNVSSKIDISGFNKVYLEGVTFDGNQSVSTSDSDYLLTINAKDKGTALGNNVTGTMCSLINVVCVNAPDGGILIRGLFIEDSPSQTQTYFENIIYTKSGANNYRTHGTKVSMVKSIITITDPVIVQTDKCVTFDGGKGLALTTDVLYPEWGMTINIPSISISNARASFLYLQNPFKYIIGNIISDKALYNDDFTDTLCPKSGVAFMKWKHIYSNNPNRTFTVYSIAFTNTNNKQILKFSDGTDSGIFRNCWRVESLFNLNIENLLFDNPYSLSLNSPTLPPSPVTINNLTKVTENGHRSGHRSAIDNFIIGTWELIDGWGSITNTTVDTIIADAASNYSIDGVFQ